MSGTATTVGYDLGPADPGPTVTDPDLVIGQSGTLELSSIVNELATPGLSGDTLTLVSATAANGTIIVGKLGTIYYEPISTTPGYSITTESGQASGDVVNPGTLSFSSDTITYTVSDQLGDTVQGTAEITVDPGPQVASGTYTVGHGQTANLTSYISSLITPGLKADVETVTSVTDIQGGVELSHGEGPGSKGSYEVAYTAPKFGNGSPDILTYTVTDQYGDTALANVAITIDPGPQATNPTLVIGSSKNGLGQIDLSQIVDKLATPGLSGDALTLVSASGGAYGGIVTNSSGDFVYQSKFGNATDTINYTVEDQYGDITNGTANILLDPGPAVANGTIIVGHGQTLNLNSYLQNLVTPGLPGDTDSIVSARAASGSVMETSFAFGNAQAIADEFIYTPPASGSDTLSYTVADEYGTEATGTVAVTVDPGPITTPVSATVQLGQSVDLTSSILAADEPGLAGDKLVIVSDNSSGTLGTVSLVNGDLVYSATGSGLASLAANGGAGDSFTYVVEDQNGDTATGTVNTAVTNPMTVINGGPYGGSTIQGVDGTEQINASGYNNTINASGGSGTINAGQGQATINAGNGNLTINLNGYNNTVLGGDGNDTVSGSEGNTTVTLGNGNDIIQVAGYTNQITVGNGNDTIVAGAGNATVVGGSGTDTVQLQGYGNTVKFTGGNDTVSGGQGSDVFNLTGGSASLALYGSNEMVFLNGTNAAIDDQGSGVALKIASGGTDVIQNFASDPSGFVDLLGGVGGYSSSSQVLAALTPDSNGGSLLALGSSGSIDFAGVTASQLHAANFHIN